jgi:transposase-like protein
VHVCPGDGNAPQAADDGPDPGLTVTAVARRLGIAPATLRSWHRRYGIGPSAHREGSHRRYTPADLDRLERMRAELLRGASAADAARAARVAEPLGTPGPAPTAASRSAPTPDEPPGRIGGRGLGLPGADPLARRLGRAVLGLDADAVGSVLTGAIGSLGVVAAWDRVARPVLVALAERWVSTGKGVEAEHLLSESLVRALAAVGDRLEPPVRPVLLACAPDEGHSLPLCALAAALAERGVAARLLGASLPIDALHSAVRRTAPAVVVLWAHAPVVEAVADGVRRRPRTRPPSRWFVAGPGWADRPLPAGVAMLGALGEATDAITAHLARSPAR